jgi:class 3 adenylate cyclase/tetratricopeptide (TPR) repeat protein
LADKILTTRSAIEGERKLVTVLFADVANYTSIAEKLGPEEVHQIMDGCFKILMDEMHKSEGTVNQFTGDGVMALFGAPVAHEDHAQRACHVALSIQNALEGYEASLKKDYGVPFKMRIGLNSGPVVVGSIGDDLRMDYTAVGDTTNLASRMESTAKPGSILVSGNTHRLVKDFFEFQPLGRIEVKGKGEPQEVFELIRTGEVETRIGASVAKGLTRFVGRNNSMAAVMEAFEKVKSGSGQVLTLVGEAGVGKSRLLLEVRNRLPQEKTIYLEGRCLHFGGSMAYLPILDILRSYFAIHEGDREYLIRKKMKEKVIGLDKNLSLFLPPFQELLSLKVEDDTFSKLEPKEKREKTFEALRDLLIRVSHEKPLVLAVEDLHWIDRTSEEFLDYLIGWLPNTPILLILLYRPEYTHQWGSKSYYTQIGLVQLGTASSSELIRAILEEGEVVPELKQLILDRAAGNPLFMEEFTHTLLENGSIEKRNEHYVFNRKPSEIQVPDTIQGIIAARMDRLEDNMKRTMQMASVIGRDFAFRILQTITDMHKELKSYLLNLQGLEFIYEKSFFPELEYIFKHALTQEVAYNSLLLKRRKKIHEKVGEAIEELYPDRLAEHYEELAYHFMQGESWKKAMEYSALVGDRAAEASANAEAKTNYQRALQAAEQITPSVPNILARLYAKHAGILANLAEYEEAVVDYQKALGLIKQANDQRGEVDILIGLSWVHYNAHREEPAAAYNEQAMALARQLDDKVCLTACLSQRAVLRSVVYGKIVDGTTDAEEVLRLSREIGDPKLLSENLTFLGMLLEWRGEFDRGLECLHEGMKLAESVHVGHTIARANLYIGCTNLARGEYEEALRCFQEVSEYADRSGDPWWISRVPNFIGGVHLELFDLEEALRLNLEGYEVARSVFSWSEPRGHSLVKAGIAHLLLGEHGPAETWFRRAEETLEEDMPLRWRWHITLLHALGELALTQGRHDEAWTYASQSLELALETDSRKHVARAQKLQGDILSANGRFEEATQTIQASIELAERLQTPREVWLGQAALGKVLLSIGKEKEAETHFTQAIHTTETIAAKLLIPSFRRSFLSAAPILEVYEILGREPPSIAP